jgi:hypothetical protein
MWEAIVSRKGHLRLLPFEEWPTLDPQLRICMF